MQKSSKVTSFKSQNMKPVDMKSADVVKSADVKSSTSSNVASKKNSYLLIGVIIIIILIVIIFIVIKNKDKKKNQASVINNVNPTQRQTSSGQQPSTQQQQQPVQPPQVQNTTRQLRPFDSPSMLADNMISKKVGAAAEAQTLSQLKLTNTTGFEPLSAGSGLNIDMHSINPADEEKNPNAMFYQNQETVQRQEKAEINALQFKEYDENRINGVVLFHMINCPMCVQVRPRLQKAAQHYPKSCVEFSDQESQPYWKKYNISEFPTLLKFENGSVYKYTGDWTHDSLQSFLQ